jgi:thiamine-phosphate pyrophosphorylase
MKVARVADALAIAASLAAMRPAGFYAVLDRPDPELARALVGPGGARVLQLRLKSSTPVSTAALLEAARMARAITREAGAALVINDRLDVALLVGADAVHLGQADLPLAAARAVIAGAGRSLAIGISTHDVAQVAAAVAGGADYLGFGPVFATSTKDNPDPVQGLAGLRAAVAAAGATPVVAIGGIAVADAAAVYATGAAAICAIAAVNGAGRLAEVVAAARALGRPAG